MLPLLKELVSLLFSPGDCQDLAKQAQCMIYNPDKTQTMAERARREYLEKYTLEMNYTMLVDIY